MRIQPYMIHVDYDHSSHLSKEKTLPAIQIQKVEPVKFDYERECWYTFNHFRGSVIDANGKSGKRMLQIAIVLEGEDTEGATVSFVTPNEMKQHELTFNHDYNLWFEPSRFNKKKGGEATYPYNSGDWITGVVHAGNLNIVVKKHGNIVLTQPIMFLPSAISMEDYEVMVSDLFRIREELVRRDKTNVTVGSTKERTARQLQKVINNLEGPIQAINANPSTALSFQWESHKIGQGEKFRLRTEVEQELYPGKNKYRVFKGYEDQEIYENKVIRQQLERLKAYCQFYNFSAPLTKADDKQKLNELKIIHEKSSQSIQELVGAQPIENMKAEEYGAHIKVMKEALTSIDKQIEEKKKSIMNRLKQLHPVAQNTSLSVPIRISCKVYSSNFNKGYVWNNGSLETSFESGWRDPDSRITPMEYSGYSYEWEGQTITIPASSYFLTIINKSIYLPEHWRLWKAFRRALQDLEAEQDFVEVGIYGEVLVKNTPTIYNNDFIGQFQAHSGYRKYTFELMKVTTVTVNGTEFADTAEGERLYDELSGFLLELDRQSERLETQRLDKQFDAKALESMQKIAYERECLETEAKIYESLALKIDEWLSLPLFQSISTLGTEQLVPTQLFLHDPYYQLVWKSLQDLQEEIGLSLIPEALSRRFGVQKVEQLFEAWALFKMIHILTTEMGWSLDGFKDVASCIDSFLNPSKKDMLKGFHAKLLMHTWMIEVDYEPEIQARISSFPFEEIKPRKPDFVFRVYEDGFCRGVIFLDAKHRNYLDQGEYTWKTDIEEVAIEKYGQMVSLSPEWNRRKLASFLIHSDAIFGMNKETSGENYNAYYNRKHFPNKIEGALNNDEAHRYGSIYLLPSATHAFKNWFRMLMEFRVGIHQTCWTCGCAKQVEVEERFTAAGYPKYYYTCKKCGEFWVKNHCTKGHKIVKHFNNYHRQVSSNYSWYIVCPRCGDGFEKDKSKISFPEVDFESIILSPPIFQDDVRF